MSGKQEKNKKKAWKKEVRRAAQNDAEKMIDENRNLKANTKILQETIIDKNKTIGFLWVALAVSWTAFIGAGVYLWLK